jgi:subtilisin family serine protease
VDTTFFIPGFDIDGNGFPNFFGTSASAPDAAAVAALVLQAAGGPGSLRPRDLYQLLQKTATPIPVSRDRTLARAIAGPLEATANGDFPRNLDYWRLAVEAGAHNVRSVSIDLTDPDMHWSDPANSDTGFHIGESSAPIPPGVTATRSADLTTLTLTFSPGLLLAGDFITFANFAFPTQLPVQFQVDADRLRKGRVTATLDDGTERTGKFHVAPKKRINRFTGAGLVNAAKAVRAARHEDDDDHDDHDHDRR